MKNQRIPKTNFPFWDKLPCWELLLGKFEGCWWDYRWKRVLLTFVELEPFTPTVSDSVFFFVHLRLFLILFLLLFTGLFLILFLFFTAFTQTVFWFCFFSLLTQTVSDSVSFLLFTQTVSDSVLFFTAHSDCFWFCLFLLFTQTVSDSVSFFSLFTQTVLILFLKPLIPGLTKTSLSPVPCSYLFLFAGFIFF